MTNDNVAKLPGKIALDLDTVQRPEKDIKGPFTFNLKGREITMIDPANIDWRDLLLMDQGAEFLRLSLSPDDAKFLRETPMPGWKFNLIMEGYYAHFDLDELQRQAQRQNQLRSI